MANCEPQPGGYKLRPGRGHALVLDPLDAIFAEQRRRIARTLMVSTLRLRRELEQHQGSTRRDGYEPRDRAELAVEVRGHCGSDAHP